MVNGQLKAYPVWDRGTRLFHWLNFLCVLALAGIGTVILYNDPLGVTDDGMVILKTTHVIVGYVFGINLFWRIVWGFIGSRYARWRNILPLGRGYGRALREQLGAIGTGRAPQYLGHSPLGRLSVTALLLLLLVQAFSGLILAGTDIFYAPLGGYIREWIAAPGVDPAALLPYHKEMYDPAAYEEMRAFRAPVVTIHLYNFYLLLCLIALHIIVVVTLDVRHRNGMISAMFNGRKVMAETPPDLETPAPGR